MLCIIHSEPASFLFNLDNVTYCRAIYRLQRVCGFASVETRFCMTYDIHVQKWLSLPRSELRTRHPAPGCRLFAGSRDTKRLQMSPNSFASSPLSNRSLTPQVFGKTARHYFYACLITECFVASWISKKIAGRELSESRWKRARVIYHLVPLTTMALASRLR